MKFEQRQTLSGIFRSYPHALPSSLSVLPTSFLWLYKRESTRGPSLADLSHTNLRSDGMSRTIYNNVLPYTRPVGASDEDAARAVYLRGLRPSCYKRDERDKRVAAGDSIETLQHLAATKDSNGSCHQPGRRTCATWSSW